MADLSAARKNMVDCQIQTNGVTMPAVLDVFERTAREVFAPAGMQNVAYMDDTLRIAADRFLLEPVVHAKMVQALQPKASDVVLDVGGATGYSAAILSPLVGRVVALENTEAYAKDAVGHWAEAGLSNITAVVGDLTKGYAKGTPYDLIFLGGAVGEVPETLCAQLEIGGRLVTILKEEGAVMGQVTIVQRLGEEQFSSYTLCEAAAPYLSGFEPKAAFTF